MGASSQPNEPGGQALIFFGKRLLFLGAHPDDIELGCGAFLAKVSSQAEVLCVTLSDNQEDPKLRRLLAEHMRSMAVLGVPEEKTRIGKFETRRFPRDRQEILQYLHELNREYRPHMVFAHSRADIHQDHGVVTEESLRAFRGTTILGYEVLRSSYGFFPRFLVEVSVQDADRKVRALAEYETYADRYYLAPEMTRATLIRHGALAERPFAEGFDVLRVVGSFTSARD